MTAERVLVGRYRVEALIGRGGMASVHRGYDLKLDRVVAIKILDPDLARDNAFRARFRMEAQSASRMAHQSIVRVFDAGEDTDRTDGGHRVVPFIVMELVEGRLLKDIIAEGDVSVAEAVRYTAGILEALEYSHRAGVIHRDIKPGNVMITPTGQIKVMDFGIARAVSDSSSTVAETTAIIGTAAYFSPEQAKGEPVDARTDLYSTGVVLYELLAGRQPFRGDSPVAVAYQHVSETPAPPSERNDAVPRSLDAVVLRALAKDPFSRFPDAATFRAALTGAGEGRAPSKRQLDHLTSELYGANPRQAAETARSLRQLSTDTTMTRTQQGPPVAWIWAGVAFIAVVLISVLVWVLGMRGGGDVPNTVRVVPDVSSMTFPDAVAEIQKFDLVAVRAEENNPSVPFGTVIRTEPASGSNTKAGESVKVFVSKGASNTTVPRLLGLSEEVAKDALTTANLMPGAVRTVNDPATEAGIVLKATLENEGIVKEGDEIAPGTIVNLTVATGKVVAGDYTGYPVDDAQANLESDSTRLTVVVQEDAGAGCGKPAGYVSRQLMEDGSSGIGDKPIGSTIVLVVCTAAP